MDYMHVLCNVAILLHLIIIIMENVKQTPVDVSQVNNWKEQKGKLKAKFSSLTDADLHFDEGKKDEMFARVQTKLGKTKEEFKSIISNL